MFFIRTLSHKRLGVCLKPVQVAQKNSYENSYHFSSACLFLNFDPASKSFVLTQ